MLVTSTFSFPTIFSKGFFLMVVQNQEVCSTELTLYHTIPTLNEPNGSFLKYCGEKEKMHVGKRENAGNQHFLYFP